VIGQYVNGGKHFVAIIIPFQTLFKENIKEGVCFGMMRS